MSKPVISKQILVQEMEYSIQKKHTFRRFFMYISTNWILAEYNKPELLEKTYLTLADLISERRNRYNRIA